MLRKRVTKLIISVTIYVAVSLITIALMFTAIVLKDNKIRSLEKSQKIVYFPDSKGSSVDYTGYVIDKSEENNKYSISVVGYGKFLVSKVEYYEIQIGKKCPDFILNRGQDVQRKAV